MAITNTVKLVLDDSQMTAGLNKLGSQVENLNSKFAGLKNILGGLALGSLIQQAVGFADAIQDIADATGIATGTILAFQSAVQDAGGKADAAGNAILKLVGNIEGAASGSAEMQAAFAKVGVSLEDIRTLSETDILKKTIDGLARVGSVSEQVALKQQLLGKEFRSVSTSGLAEAFANSNRESQRYAEQIKAAADAQQRLESAVRQLKLSLLEAIKPALDLINALDIKTITEFVDALIKIGTVLVVFKAFGAAVAALEGLAVAFGLAGVAAIKFGIDLLKMFTPIGRALALIAGSVALIQGLFPNFAKSIGDAFEKAGNKVKELFGIETKPMVDQAEVNREIQALQNRSKTLEENKNAVRDVTDSNQKFYDSLTKLVSAYQLGNVEANKRYALETQLIGASEAAKIAANERFNIESKYLQELGKLTDEYAQKREAANKGDPKAAEALPKIQAAIQGLTDAYKVQIVEVDKLTAARVKSVQAEQLAIFATKSFTDAQAAANDLAAQAANMFLPLQAKGYAEVEQAARKAAAAQIAAEESRRGAKLDPAEATRYYEAARQGIESVKAAQEALNEATNRYNLLQFQRKTEIDINKQVRDLQHEMATSTMTAIEKKYADITHAAEENARAAIEAEEARRGQKLDPREAEAYYEAARKGAEKLKAATEVAYSKSREFSTGWKRALNEYADEATNAAKRAESIFKKATQGMEDALVNFAKTGKFEWKGFVASMLEELLRSQIQQIFAQLLGGMQTSMGAATSGMTGMFGGGQQGQGQGGGGGILDSIMGIFGMGGGGAPGSSANNPMYVIDISGGMGGGGFMGPQQQAGGGSILDSIMGLFGGGPEQLGGPGYEPSGGGFFDTLTTGISDLFEGFMGPKQLGGPSDGGGFFDSLTSGIGSLFDGWFANGGQIGAGKFGIVGENGPEFVSGPATVTPMGGSTSVTYNINAVDAMSFKQMIAQDPSFLYGVMMQGAGGIPARR